MSKNRGRERGLEHEAEQRVGGTFSLQRGRRQGSRTREGEKERETRFVMGNRTVFSYLEAPVCDEC